MYLDNTNKVLISTLAGVSNYYFTHSITSAGITVLISLEAVNSFKTTKFIYSNWEYIKRGKIRELFKLLARSKDKTVSKPKGSKYPLPLFYGLELESNKPIISDLTKAPHLLIAGASDSGKGVTITNILLHLIENTKEKIELSIIDMKLTDYQLFTQLKSVNNEIISELEDSIKLLEETIKLSKDRQSLFAKNGVRNIGEYNKKFPNKKLDYKIILIDEMAELTLTFKGDLESKEKAKLVNLITRITQIARSAGIHLILATQRPVVDVINGLIKANCNAKIGLRMENEIDSKVIGLKGCHNIKSKHGYAIMKDNLLYKINEKIKIPFIPVDKLESEIKRLQAMGK
jgi:S-DNA-T family DNA segregation ATPase FtsK/SpoIIIE